MSESQTMPWPRKNIKTPYIAHDAIPLGVVEAQLQLALLVNGGTDLIPVSTGNGILIKEKIGPIENMYSEKAGVSTNGLPILPGVSALLDPWLLGTFEGFVGISITSVGPRHVG